MTSRIGQLIEAVFDHFRTLDSAHARRMKLAARLLRTAERRHMDITKMLAELRGQREKLDRLIVAAEDYASSGARRRGRPPKWMQTIKKRGRPPGSKNKTTLALTKAS